MSRDIAAHIRVVGIARVMSLATAVFPRDGFRFLRKLVKVKKSLFLKFNVRVSVHC